MMSVNVSNNIETPSQLPGDAFSDQGQEAEFESLLESIQLYAANLPQQEPDPNESDPKGRDITPTLPIDLNPEQIHVDPDAPIGVVHQTGVTADAPERKPHLPPFFPDPPYNPGKINQERAIRNMTPQMQRQPLGGSVVVDTPPIFETPTDSKVEKTEVVHTPPIIELPVKTEIKKFEPTSVHEVDDLEFRVGNPELIIRGNKQAGEYDQTATINASSQSETISPTYPATLTGQELKTGLNTSGSAEFSAPRVVQMHSDSRVELLAKNKIRTGVNNEATPLDIEDTQNIASKDSTLDEGNIRKPETVPFSKGNGEVPLPSLNEQKLKTSKVIENEYKQELNKTVASIDKLSGPESDPEIRTSNPKEPFAATEEGSGDFDGAEILELPASKYKSKNTDLKSNQPASIDSVSGEFQFTDRILDSFSKTGNTNIEDAIESFEVVTPPNQISSKIIEEFKAPLEVGETKTLKIKLNPEELGEVELTVEKNSDGKLDIVVEVESEFVAKSIVEGIEALKSSIAASGTEIGSFDVQEFERRESDENEESKESALKEQKSENSIEPEEVLQDETKEGRIISYTA